MKIRWTIWTCGHNLWRKLTYKMFLAKIIFRSLCYNEFNDCYYFMDTLMEPLFWFVDHFTKALGPIFVAMVVMLTAAVVAVAFVIGLPYWLHHSLPTTYVALIIGHWLLINVTFHYYMAFVTSPGFPPEGALIPEAVSICKKCIAPKPPRTHHCSVCNRCILKMDHHCPWLNNCIGYFNHRYFFLYCVYTWLGTLFLMVFGYHIAYEHFFVGHEGSTILKSNFSELHESILLKQLLQKQSHLPTVEAETLGNPYLLVDPNNKFYHSVLVFVTLVCISVFLALGALTMWHARLITQGQTSIEAHINKKETKRLLKELKVYRNPYDFGARSNWQLFLGLVNRRGWRYVLLPSAHPPQGDGLRWHTHEKVYCTASLFK